MINVLSYIKRSIKKLYNCFKHSLNYRVNESSNAWHCFFTLFLICIWLWAFILESVLLEFCKLLIWINVIEYTCDFCNPIMIHILVLESLRMIFRIMWITVFARHVNSQLPSINLLLLSNKIMNLYGSTILFHDFLRYDYPKKKNLQCIYTSHMLCTCNNNW